MRVTTSKILGNLGLLLCIVLSVNGATIYFNPNTYSVTEGDLDGATSIDVNVCHSPVNTMDTRAYISTTDSSAVSGSDFTPISSNTSVTIPASISCTPHTINITSDSIPEQSEQFLVELSPVDSSDQVLQGFQTATVTIDDDDNPAVVSISLTLVQDTVTEGDVPGQTSVTVNICHSPSTIPTTAYVSTLSGTAVAGLDFESVSTRAVTLPANVACIQYPISIVSDVTPEETEQFFVQLTSHGSSVQVSRGSQTATITITDDDATLSFNSVMYTETEGTSVRVIICHNPTSSSTSGYITTVAGTALSGFDFTPVTSSNGTFTIPSGQPCTSYPISIVSDSLPEETEQFTVQLFASSSSVTVPAESRTATVTINDDDSQDVTVSFKPVMYNVTEGNVNGGTSVNVMICHNPTSSSTSGFIFTVAGTAQSGFDFIPVMSNNGSFTIPSGQPCTSSSIIILSDSLPEETEQFTVLLFAPDSSVTVSAESGTATVTINDDDSQDVTLSFNPVMYNITEGNVNGGTSVDVMICHNPTSSSTSGFIFTVAGTAESGSDFLAITPNSGAFTIPPGQSCTSSSIIILSDTLPEETEQFTVQLLASDSSVTVPAESGTATVTINDDDSQEGTTSMPPSSTPIPAPEFSTTPSLTTISTTPELDTTPAPSPSPTTPALNCKDNIGSCGENASCVNTTDGFVCSCNEGFSPKHNFQPMESSCSDINECEEDDTLHECVDGGCVNTDGSYICICPDGYYESGLKKSGRQDCEACNRSEGIDHMFGSNCSQPCTCATGADCAEDTGICTGNNCGNPFQPTCDKNDLVVTLTTTPPNGEVSEGNRFYLMCSVNLLSTDVSLFWTGPSGEVIKSIAGKYIITSHDSISSYNGMLQVLEANSTDTGMYNCTATLHNRTDDVLFRTDSVRITVLVQGDIISELPAKRKEVSGSNLTLTCEVFGYNSPTVQWLFMNESAEDTFSNANVFVGTVFPRRTANLTFYNLNKNNSGIYTCQVTMDSTETDSADVTLIVVDLPKIANLDVIITTDTSLLLRWIITDNGSDTLQCRANYTTTTEGSSETEVEDCSGNDTCWLLGLSPYTNYIITVECRNKAGYNIDPLSTSARTLSSGPSAPRNPTVEDSSGQCVVTWEVSESPNGPGLYYEVTQTIRDTRSGELDESPGPVRVDSGTRHELQKGDMMLNSEYTFKICANNSEHEGDCADASGSCVTNPGAPDSIPTIATPNQETAVNSSSVTITVPEVDDRNGPISCYEFVVVKRKAGESGGGSPDDVQYDDIKTEPGDDDSPYRSVVMNHDEYVSKNTVTIGSDARTITRCTLEITSSRRQKRANMVKGGGDLEATNAPLESGTNYDIFMRSYSETSDGMFQYTSSDYVSVTTTGAGPSAGLIVFLVILILLIFAISIAVFVVWRKRNMSDKPGTVLLPMSANVNGDNIKSGGIDNPGFDMITEVPPINIDQLGESILEKHKHNDRLFLSEFKSLMSTNPQATIEAFNNLANKDKNRYINIPCYDHSRVKLNIIDDDENSDYINANYVDGYSVPEKFIAAQGPKEETVEDFWRMIWEQNSKTIIMLTRCFESGRDKCFQYWPDSGEVTYGKFTVCLDNTLECPDYVIRQLRISMNKEGDEEDDNEETENRTVMQFHFLAWPDHGVPEYPYTMLAFIKRIRQMTQNKPEKGQIVIHCSAGVGRTGTYITIDAMLDRLKEEKTVDIFNYIQKIRLQRSTLVQSQVQYVFIYHALHEEHLYGHTEVKLNDLKQYFRRLRLKTLQDDNSPLHIEFKTAATLPVKDTSTKEASKLGNKEKNRIRNYLPYDKNRVNLERLVGDENSTYINASYINGYERRNMYIITQAPMENTASDFWRMVWDSLTSTVVMLTDLEEKGNEMCVKFWPEEEPKTFGNLTIELSDQEEEESFTIKDFTLSNNQGVSGRKVRMYQFHGWPEIGVPDCDSVTYLVTVSHEYQKAAEEEESADQSKHPIIVFCHTGVGRTAIWCALSILLDRAKAEGVVDVFQTVRTLRQQRQHMVQDTTQYEFLYQAVLSHLGKLDDMYENFQS